MKLIFKTLFLLFISVNSFAQVKIDSLISSALIKKEQSYFELQKDFRRIRLNQKEAAQLLEGFKNNKYPLGEAFAYNLLGRNFRKNTEYDSAILNYKKALTIARNLKSIEAEIVTLNQLGVVNRRLDKIRAAFNYHQLALEIISKIPNPNEDVKVSHSISINSIGNIYLTLKQYDLALERFQSSIKIQESLKDIRGLAINHQNIGYAHKNIGDLDLALENFQKSLDYNNSRGDKLGKIICHNSISDILIQKGKYKEAEKYIIEVLELAKELNNKYYLAEVYNTLAWASIKLNKVKVTKEYLDEAYKIGRERKIPSTLAQTHLVFSELYTKKGKHKSALENYQKSIQLENKIFDEKNITWIANLMSRYDSELKSNELRSLAKEKEIAELNLTRNRNILIITLVTLALFSVVLYSIYRQRLLKNDKKILMLEQEALQSQMNPHFVFNALNSIKLYIINNEQKNAVYYLNKFSKLIRNILDASKVKEVSLSEELSTMNLYMTIENIRFSNEIEYIEKIDETINLERVKVPPLILQPFLENAIWHGLSSKKGEKEVVLSVQKISEDFIKIEIIDNGVGRDQATKIKKSKTLNRKSIGIDLTKKRLHNFTNEFKNDYSLEYIDLYDEDGNAIGTTVSIKIPFV